MTDTPWRQNKKQTPAKSIEESSLESASKFRRIKGQIGAAIQRSVGVRRDVTITSRFESNFRDHVNFSARDPRCRQRPQPAWRIFVLR
jgi:hypothetical protein